LGLIRNPQTEFRNPKSHAMFAFLRQRWFLLALVAALWTGISWPESAGPIVRWLPSEALVAVVTFIMALPLETAALWQAARRPGPAWLATALNSGLAPPLGWLASRTLPPELATGMIVATTVPCTLATAAVWTRRAGGNDAVAFLVTIITNLTCFLVVPAWLWLLVGVEARSDIVRANIDYGRIAAGLVLLVVLPIVAAQALRQWPRVGSWGVRHKHPLSLTAQCGVLMMVLVGAVDCGERLGMANGGSALSAASIVTMIFAVTLVHVALLLLGFTFSKTFAFDRADAIAVGFAGSQKTLMVGAYLAMAVGPLAILPMVAYHAAQLIVDTLVADWLRHKSNSANVQLADNPEV
jgi:solute carrier family 10 (sodium/bile acid cotransporter), member 7